MIVREMPWEERNLGVKAVEFIVEDDDTVDSVRNECFHRTDYDYQVLRLGVAKSDIGIQIEGDGFRYSETMLYLDRRIGDEKEAIFPIEGICNVKVSIATSCEVELVYNAIREGLFTTDKVALDPEFGLEIAANRYVNWIEQVLSEKVARLYIVRDNETPVAFFVLKDESKSTDYCMLMGVLNKESYRGYGVVAAQMVIAQAKNNGKNKISVAISTNNIASLRTNIAMGYNVKKAECVYIKHVNK